MPKKKLPKETDRARVVLKHAELSIDNFRNAFETVREARKKSGSGSGAPTDGEQDLIRASLTFAAAGLDSTIKELIKGAVRSLAEKDSEVKNGLEEYAKRQLRDDKDGDIAKNGAGFLAKILVSSSPYDQLLENYTQNLTGSSLQSVEELFKASSALGIKVEMVNSKRKELREIFKIRNKIIHELDVGFDVKHGQRERNSRTKKGLNEMSDLLLEVAEEYIKAVNSKLLEHAKS